MKALLVAMAFLFMMACYDAAEPKCDEQRFPLTTVLGDTVGWGVIRLCGGSTLAK